MPDLLPWLYAVMTVGGAIVPVGWYGVSLYRDVLRDNKALELRLQAVEQELYGKMGDNGLKGRLAEVGKRTHDVPTIKSIVQLIEEEHDHKQRMEGK